MIAVVKFFEREGLVIISDILNVAKHVKSPSWCVAHSRCSWNTGSLPLWRWCQWGWSSIPWCAPWCLRIWARRRGPVFICWLPSPSSLSFLMWFLWRRGSLSNSARAAPVPSVRSAFAILTGCCGDAVTRLGIGAPGLSWCGCHGDGSLLEEREGGQPQPCAAVALLPAGLQLKNHNISLPPI